MTFERWMEEVDLICRGRFGLSIYDLPDMLFRDAFDSETSPEGFMDGEIPDLEALGELILS